MYDVLSGTKGWFLWYGSQLGDPWAAGARRLLRSSGAQAIALKLYDGPNDFQQPFALSDLRAEIEQLGPVLTGAWGYHYGRDLGAELAQVRRCLRLPHCDFVILNVEDPAVESNPDTPATWDAGLESLRADWPHASLYFCSHAQPLYHQAQPYYQATQHNLIHMPMIYHTAMGMRPDDAVRVSIGQYNNYALLHRTAAGGQTPWSGGGAAYGTLDYPSIAGDVATWGEAAIDAGATSLIWWDAASGLRQPDILRAIRELPRPGRGKEMTADG